MAYNFKTRISQTMKRIGVCCWVLIFIVFTAVNSRASEPFMKHYGVDEGVPASVVYQVIQDQRGYIWMATDKGVVRFNGQKFKKFNTANGLPRNTVFWMNEDHNGRIWLNHVGKTLSVVNNNAISTYQHQEILDSWLDGDIINFMHVDNHGNMWVGAITGEFGKCSIICISPEGAISEIEETKDFGISIKSFPNGSYVVGVHQAPAKSHHKIQFFRNDEQQLIDFGSNPFKKQKGANIQKVNNTDWVLLAGSEVLLISKGKIVSRKLVGEPTNSLFYDRAGNIWIGLRAGGVLKLNSTSLTIEARILDRYVVSCIYQDSEGGYWFPTLENGVFYSSNIHLKMFTQKSGLANVRFSDLANRNDTLWVSGIDGRITLLYENRVLGWQRVGKFIGHMRVMGESMNIHGANDALYLTTLPQAKARTYALSSAVDNNGDIWLGSVKGVERIDDKTQGKQKVDSSFTHRVDAIACFMDTIWAGSVDGLFFWASTSFKEAPGIHPICRNRIKRMEVIRDHLAIATRSNGLVIYKGGRSYLVNETTGLQSNLLNDMCILNDTIWLASDKGISAVYLPEKSSKWTVKNYSVSHGLPTTEIEHLLVRPNEIWFTCHKGLGYLPQRRFSKPVSPRIYLTGVRFNEQDTTLLSTYSVGYQQNRMEVSYETVSFRSQQRHYKYKLLPISPKWISTNQNSMKFNSLAPGRYQFSVQAADANGMSENNSLSFDLIVQKAFWQTHLFYVVVFLLTTASLALMYKLNLRRVQKRYLLEREFEKMANKTMIAQMNPHFIYNSLNTIQSFIAKNDAKSSMRYVAKFSRLMRRTFQNSTKDLISLREEISALKLYVELESHRRQRSIEIEVVSTFDTEFSAYLMPPMLFQPFVENAIIHGILPSSVENGKVVVELQHTNQGFRVYIQNNGLPMSEEVKLRLVQFVANKKQHEFDGSAASRGLTLTLSRILANNYRNAPNMPFQFEIEQGADKVGTSFGFNLSMQKTSGIERGV